MIDIFEEFEDTAFGSLNARARRWKKGFVPKDRKKSTPRKGSASPVSKLTEEQVRLIKAEYKEVKENAIYSNVPGTGYRHIAKKYNVSRETVGALLKGRTWKHVS